MIKKLLSVATCYALLAISVKAQQTDALPRSTPEAEGVSSKAIEGFINAAAKSKTEFHSFMLVRHGKVIAEGWWKPYGPNLKHTMYSTSKSFTATAIGFAVTEKKLQLTDKVVSFFPGELPDTVTANLAALTVKDVLSMSDGQDPDPTYAAVSTDSNWVKRFLSTPIINKPGSKFLYNSLGTYMLSAIVQKVTGQKTIDYLRPRLFEPLGIAGMDWEIDPHGINTGGWGLRIKTEDMAKFGQLFLQKGQWKGKQVIPASWVEEASTAKIIQHPDLPQAQKDSSDWEQGYCYQMWRCRNNAFRGDGAFGQFIIVMPAQDAVMAITAETQDMQEEINLVWNHLLPAMQQNKQPEADNKLLKKELADLALPIPAKNINQQQAAMLSGKTFHLSQNEKELNDIRLDFKADQCTLTLKSDDKNYSLSFGAGQWQQGETTRPGPYLLTNVKAKFAGLPPFKIAGAYEWQDEHTLKLTLRYIESPHSETITCHFDQDNITLDFSNSIERNKKTTITGTIQK